MIIATPDGKFYSELWTEEDNFSQVHYREITKRYAEHLCKKSDDFIVFRRLGLLERLHVTRKPPIDAIWEDQNV